MYFVCFVVPTLGRPQAPRMSSLQLPEAARDHLAPACNRSTSQRLWNHEIHENPRPQAQGKGCRIGRFVCGRSKVNAYGRVPSPGARGCGILAAAWGHAVYSHAKGLEKNLPQSRRAAET